MAKEREREREGTNTKKNKRITIRILATRRHEGGTSFRLKTKNGRRIEENKWWGWSSKKKGQSITP